MGPERMTPEYLQPLAALGSWQTLRVPVHSESEARDVLDAVQPYPTLSVLILIEKPDLGLVTSVLPVLLKAWPGRLAGIELCNECDLQNVSAQDFGGFVWAAYLQLTHAGFTGDILSGGIYTVDDETLNYLVAAMVVGPWPQDITLGLHWYGDVSDHWLAEVQAFGHRTAVTEYGIPSRTPAGDAAQVAYLTSQTAAFQRLGASYALIYQCCSGPSASNLDNFGLWRFDGSQKPAFSLLK